MLSSDNCGTESDARLAGAIRRALTIWPDRFGANSSSLGHILKSFSNTVGVSNFRPTVAAALIQRYTPSGGRVLDFAAGYGGRLLGAQITGRTYYGIDPSFSQVRGLTKMVRACQKIGDAPPAIIRRNAAETILPQLRPATSTLCSPVRLISTVNGMALSANRVSFVIQPLKSGASGFCVE